ncbi:MAG: hypothetical protein JSU05_15895, partial [Bacteroidetes bacterium]|nr:hypothetical protein [Bacteroidota bacterium]
AFTYSGICFSRPTDFFDASTSVYGTVNSWSWDFGEPGITSDFSTSQNPIYTYPTMSNKIVVLTATDTKGCKDTVSQVVPIQDKPAISLAFRDTLICVSDAVQLQASGNGIFSWTPNINISNPGSATPIVSPVTTTTYIVSLDDQGCHNKDSVKVRVIDHVSLAAMNDTTICRGDTIRLHVVSDGLHYNWTPSNQFIDPSLANPLAVTFTTTTYQVTAIVGSCSATDNVMVKTIPYPYANAGNDVTICYNSSVQLHGTMDGIAASWSPSGSLNDPHILNPVASPPQTTSYVLSVTDVKGCPKPGRDTVIVTVLPKIIPFAGRDTAVVIGQPLQLNASGGFAYQWIPSDYLSSSVIANPVAQFDIPIDAIRYKVLVFDEANCVDSAFITVKVFKSMPTIFVPSAFTP